MKLIVTLLVCCATCFCSAQSIQLVYDKASPQATYAAAQLRQAFAARGFEVARKAGYRVTLVVAPELDREAFSVEPGKNGITIRGGSTGVIYGSFALAEHLKNSSGKLTGIPAMQEKPHLPFRAIKYDLPWDTYRHSYALSQHQETCKSLAYWERFLDMMVENRLNVLTLWNLHPYVFLIRPKNFPEASPFSESEQSKWKQLFTGIFRMARERGIDTYIMPFNIFVTPEFARAHNVAMNNLDHHHFVDGDTSEIVKRYTRECVTQMLQEYPDLSGVGLTLGEGMGGMTPQQREDWMRATFIEGMRLAGRPSKLIHRIPFSSTTGSLGPTSKETELITRRGIEQEAALPFIEGPVWADLKFNWSHAHSTTKLVKVHGGKLYGGYFEPVPEDYKIIWTARNEDFFCLRWGVPSFVRSHILENSQPYVGGYIIGSETYIPAKDYFTKEGTAVPWQYAFERQWLFYKLWGRLLYNPHTADDVFRNDFIARYGEAGQSLYQAAVLAGATPLRLASSFDLGWDFTLYSEGFMALDPRTKRVEYITTDRLIHQPPLDPQYVSVEAYVKGTLDGDTSSWGPVKPPLLAGRLQADCEQALSIVNTLPETNDQALLQELADVRVWSYLGLHHAEKLRAAVALQTYHLTGAEEQKQSAIGHLEKALQYWDEIVVLTKPIYKPMPLVHYSEQDGKSWQENDSLRFHWELLRADVVKDLEAVRMSKAMKL